MDQVEKTNKIIESARESAIVTAQKYATPKKISSLIEMLLSIVCLVGIKLIELGFDFSELLKLKNWISIALSTIGIWLLYRAVINARYDKTAMRDSVVAARTRYNNATDRKDLSLKVYLEEFNLKTKISVYVAKINHKIDKMERKRYNANNPSVVKKYDAKLAQLKFLISEEYIKANIDKMKIKYYQVFYSDFCQETVRKNAGQIMTRQTYNSGFNRASFRKMWMYVLSSALTLIPIVNFSSVNKTTLISSILATVLMIVTRIVTALLEADALYDERVTQTYIDRTIILEEFFEWKLNNPTELEKHDSAIRKELKIEYEEKANNLIEQALNKLK